MLDPAVHVEILRPLRRRQKHPHGRGAQRFGLGGRAPCRRRERERLRVVVGEQLRVIGDTLADGRLEPFGDESMLPSALGARDLPVRDVAHQQVREREFTLPLERRRPGGAHEIAVGEVDERGLNGALVAT